VVRNFQEKAGLGVSGEAGGIHVALGSRTWLESLGIPTQEANANVQVGIDGRHRGGFALRNGLRPDLDQMLAKLAAGRQLFLLSGDNERERELFQQFPALQGNLRFNQSPVDKLAFVRNLQAERKTVMMVGDGLNDAGALKQSDAGMAVVEHSGAFSPASDIICTADQVHELPGILEFAKLSTRIVRLSFGISALYNVLGITIAAAGILSPLICAVLMPASSISVVLFACGATSRAARRLELTSSATGPGFPFPSQAT
jgi:Cu+-exporting ATPase